MKFTLPSVAGGYNLQLINENFQTIANELNTKVWYRNNVVGEPNTIAQDMDLNGKRLFNLPQPVSPSEPVTLEYANLYLAGNDTSELIALAGQVAADAVLVQELADTATLQAGIAITEANLAITAAGEAAIAAASITYPIPVGSGGTGQTTVQAAINTLTGVSAATIGDVLVKAPDGNAKFVTPTPTSGTSDPVIAILGDSLTGVNLAQIEGWPSILGRALNNGGSPCKIVNYAVSGGTFYRANTLASFGAQTPVQAVIAANPSVVIVMLGANDLLVGIDGRSLAQVQSDAATTLSTLQAALPSAKIIYVSELCYDSANFTPGTLLNKGLVPAFMTLKASGILAGSYCSEILTDTPASGVVTAFTNWATFNTYCQGLTWTGSFTLNYFKIARMGLTVPDGLHPTAAGVLNIASQILVGLSTVSGITTVLPWIANTTTTFTANSSVLFSNLLIPSGSGYSEIYTSDGEKFNYANSPSREYLPGEWYYPYKGKLTYAPTSTLSYAARSAIIFRVTGVVPNTVVELSVAGGAFSNLTISSDDRGEVLYITDSQGFGGTGTFSFRYKIGTSITPIITITITA